MNACLINGVAITSLTITDRAIQYGDGLFETIALKHGVMSYWPEHYQRLLAGCERLKFPPPNEALLLQDIDAVKQDLEKAVIKIIITRSSERGYRIPADAKTKRIVQCFDFPHYPDANYHLGIRAIFCKTPVSENSYLAGIKHLSRLDNVLASSEWDHAIIDEGLMTNAQGHIIQGTKSNLFCVKNNSLYTPDLSYSGVLGVMRAHILQWAKLQSITVKIIPITPDELLSMDEIFVCNSIFGIWPVRDLDGHIYPVGKMTTQLRDYFCKGEGINEAS